MKMICKWITGIFMEGREEGHMFLHKTKENAHMLTILLYLGGLETWWLMWWTRPTIHMILYIVCPRPLSRRILAELNTLLQGFSSQLSTCYCPLWLMVFQSNLVAQFQNASCKRRVKPHLHTRHDHNLHVSDVGLMHHRIPGPHPLWYRRMLARS